MEKTVYYALLLEGDTPGAPSGLARRHMGVDGEFTDEAFKRDGSWGYTPTIAGAQRGDMTFELVEVSEEEAERIIEHFRAKWASQG